MNEDSTTAGLPDGTFAGKPYFNCPKPIFAKCVKGRKKFQRWKSFMGEDDFMNKVRAYQNKNRKTDVLFRNGNEFMHVRKLF